MGGLGGLGSFLVIFGSAGFGSFSLSISAAFLIKSSSLNVLRTLCFSCPDLGESVRGGVSFGLMGKLRGIVSWGAVEETGLLKVFGIIKGIVRSDWGSEADSLGCKKYYNQGIRVCTVCRLTAVLLNSPLLVAPIVLILSSICCKLLGKAMLAKAEPTISDSAAVAIFFVMLVISDFCSSICLFSSSICLWMSIFFADKSLPVSSPSP